MYVISHKTNQCKIKHTLSKLKQFSSCISLNLGEENFSSQSAILHLKKVFCLLAFGVSGSGDQKSGSRINLGKGGAATLHLVLIGFLFLTDLVSVLAEGVTPVLGN